VRVPEGSLWRVAEHLGLRWEGVELNPQYARLLPDRVAEVRAYYARRAGRALASSARGLEQLGLFGAA
jgi:DNA modification methylase